MRVLGVDPSTRATGFGLVETTGNRLVRIRSGEILSRADHSLPKRLAHLFRSLQTVLEGEALTAVAIEGIFYSRNVQSTMKLGHARGVVMLTAALAGIEVVEYSPQEVKRALAGTGRATKTQVKGMVERLLGVPPIASEDETDALALAITHIHANRVREILGREGVATRARGARLKPGAVRSAWERKLTGRLDAERK